MPTLNYKKKVPISLKSFMRYDENISHFGNNTFDHMTWSHDLNVK